MKILSALLLLALSSIAHATEPTFKKDIRPILKAKCTKCHGFLVKQKKLDLRSLKAVLKGGESGPSVIPGDPAKSPLIAALSLPKNDIRRMPPAAEKDQLTPDEITLLNKWVKTGAK